MSIPTIAAILEKRLLAMAAQLPTAFENQEFTPPVGAPYQRAYLLPNAPIERAITLDLTEWRGLFQITVCYPLGQSRGAAQARAQVIADHFAPPQDVTQAGIRLSLLSTPHIKGGQTEETCYAVPVVIAWSAFKT